MVMSEGEREREIDRGGIGAPLTVLGPLYMVVMVKRELSLKAELSIRQATKSSSQPSHVVAELIVTVILRQNISRRL